MTDDKIANLPENLIQQGLLGIFEDHLEITRQGKLIPYNECDYNDSCDSDSQLNSSLCVPNNSISSDTCLEVPIEKISIESIDTDPKNHNGTEVDLAFSPKSSKKRFKKTSRKTFKNKIANKRKRGSSDGNQDNYDIRNNCTIS